MDENKTTAQVAVMRVKYGTWVIISGLIAVVLVFLGAVGAFIAGSAVLKPTASDVTTIISIVVTELGVIVGAYFGVQIGASGVESIQTQREIIENKGWDFIAPNPPPGEGGYHTPREDLREEFKEAIAKPSYPEISLRSLFTGYLVPIIAAPFVGIGVGLATSLSRPSPILDMSFTVLAGTISSIAGVFVGIRAGIEIKKSAEVARTAVAKAVIDMAADVAASKETSALSSFSFGTGADELTSASASHIGRSRGFGSPPSAPGNVSTVST